MHQSLKFDGISVGFEGPLLRPYDRICAISSVSYAGDLAGRHKFC